MTRLLVAGAGPRPAPGLRQVFAPGLRLDAMAGALAASGQDVRVVEVLPPSLLDGPATQHDPPTAARVLADPAAAARALRLAAREHKPDAMVALADVAALAASRCGFDGPLFVDYYGHPMAERQAQCAVHANDDALAGAWLHVLPALLRGDAFGALSDPQADALRGELGAAGRLNAATDGHDLVRVLRTALPFENPFAHSGEPPLRGTLLPDDARLLLFSGGYNNWLDDELLLAAVERLLAADPRAHYVSTGGAIAGNVSRVFERFRAGAEASPHRARFHFLGWVEHQRLEDLCLEADAGVACDTWTLEGRFGARTRALTWLWAGMRAVLSDPSDLTAELHRDGLARALPQGNADDLGAALAQELALGRLPDAEAASRREHLAAHYGPAARFAPLLDWAADPRPAPDRVGGVVRNPLADWQRRALRAGQRDVALAELLARLEGSRLLRLWLARQPRLRRLIKDLRR